MKLLRCWLITYDRFFKSLIANDFSDESTASKRPNVSEGQDAGSTANKRLRVESNSSVVTTNTSVPPPALPPIIPLQEKDNFSDFSDDSDDILNQEVTFT